MDRLREAREAAGMDPPNCDNCALDCSDRIPGHSPCTGWHGGRGTINVGPTEEEVYEREVEASARKIAEYVFAYETRPGEWRSVQWDDLVMDQQRRARDAARAVLTEIRR
jgi:hypothetical protein